MATARRLKASRQLFTISALDYQVLLDSDNKGSFPVCCGF